MKKLVYLILFLQTINIYAQPDGTIDTPKGNSVEYYNGTLGDTASYRVYAESLINVNNWDATMEAPATGKYNCHAFAWDVSEDGSEHWVDGWDYGDLNLTNGSVTPTNTATNLNEYWTNDGGYHNISNKTAKAKVHYGSQWVWEYTINGYRWVNKKDHSAVVDSNTNYFSSKWGALPRYKHKPADCPYYATSLTYYKLDNPLVLGSSGVLCDNTQRTFTESTLTYIDLDYDWSTQSPLSEVSGDGTSSYTVEGTSNIGVGTIYLTVTTPSGATASAQKSIGVNRPHYSDLDLELLTTGGSPASYMCSNTHYHIFLNNSSGCSLSNYTWSIPSGWTKNYTYNNMISVYTNSSPGGMVEVNTTTCCGVNTKVITDYFGSGYCGGYYSMSFSPNPTTGETVLTIESENKEKTFDETAQWELEVYSPTQTLKEKITNLKGNNTKIQTHGWKEGVYVVRVKFSPDGKTEEVLTGKLVVKK